MAGRANKSLTAGNRLGRGSMAARQALLHWGEGGLPRPPLPCPSWSPQSLMYRIFPLLVHLCLLIAVCSMNLLPTLHFQHHAPHPLALLLITNPVWSWKSGLHSPHRTPPSPNSRFLTGATWHLLCPVSNRLIHGENLLTTG